MFKVFFCLIFIFISSLIFSQELKVQLNQINVSLNNEFSFTVDLRKEFIPIDYQITNAQIRCRNNGIIRIENISYDASRFPNYLTFLIKNVTDFEINEKESFLIFGKVKKPCILCDFVKGVNLNFLKEGTYFSVSVLDISNSNLTNNSREFGISYLKRVNLGQFFNDKLSLQFELEKNIFKNQKANRSNLVCNNKVYYFNLGFDFKVSRYSNKFDFLLGANKHILLGSSSFKNYVGTMIPFSIGFSDNGVFNRDFQYANTFYDINIGIKNKNKENYFMYGLSLNPMFQYSGYPYLEFYRSEFKFVFKL